MNIIRGSVVGLAGMVGVGVLAWPAASAATEAGEVYLKRNEQSGELVAVEDDELDDDRTNDRASRAALARDTASRDTRSRDSRSRDKRSRASKASRDHTNSRRSKVSRDRDRSRGDRTRDWTRDGGDRTRDWSANRTNDRSRNDTRRKPRR